MNIKILLTNDNDLLKEYFVYIKCIAEINAHSIEKRLELAELISNQANKINKILNKQHSNDCMILTEDYYEKNISDDILRLSLMNGVYDFERITKIVRENEKHISKDFLKILNKIISKMKDDNKLLFWNY